ncbi:MAG: hypothetical protein H7175_03195 [Burkholderiales bacterium]|nr:hypothetical protein [Anaerolineae bacterium]
MNKQRKTILVITTVLTIALLTTAGVYAVFITNFEGFAINTSAEGLVIPSAQLSSPFIPNDWRIEQNNGDYISLSNHILASNRCNAALIVRMDEPHSAVRFNFGTDPSVVVLKVDAWMGAPGPGTLVFSKNFNGVNIGSPVGMLEGVARVSGLGDFDHLVIYTIGGCMAMDNLTVRGN